MRVDPVCDVDFRSAPLSVILRLSLMFSTLQTRVVRKVLRSLCFDQCASASDFERGLEAVRVDLSRFSFIPQKININININISNNNYAIWRGSVLTGEELPPYSGELKHALSLECGPTQSQLSRRSSRHHISMEHRLRRKHRELNPDTDAGSGMLRPPPTRWSTSAVSYRSATLCRRRPRPTWSRARRHATR